MGGFSVEGSIRRAGPRWNSGRHGAWARGLQGLLEEELKADGIKIQWNYLRGAGPTVNELFANGLIDFGFALGDLPSISDADGKPKA